jgi:hypothetical protein
LPTKGYQTITLKSTVFSMLVEAYEKRKRDLIMEDIKSYTAYAQRLLESAIERDLLEGRFEMVGRYDNSVTVRDHYRVKEAEVGLKGGKVFCQLDRSGDCDHVGFVLSDPETIKRAKQLGIKLRRKG